LLDNQSMETCLKWGNISGGLSTTELGGTTCRISIHTIQEAMAKYYSL
jgi:sugar/nucleoside kinase (ribokinase family)